MAAIIWTDVTNHFAEMSAVDANARTDILAYANERVKVCLSGGEESITTKLLRIYLAAHLGKLTLNKVSGGGPVIMEQVGPVMKQYAAASSDAALEETIYGRAFKQFARNTPARGPMVI